MRDSDKTTIRVAETFAGVGGFSVGFGHANDELGYRAFDTVWANQWEPDGRDSKQFAWRCYERHYGKGSCVNEDVSKVLDDVEAGKASIPDYDLLCGGFPCFTAGQLVITADGTKPIEDVRVGDLVLTHRGRYRKVLRTMSHVTDTTIVLHGTGACLNGGNIECTPNHRFLAYGTHGTDAEDGTSWVEAHDMPSNAWVTPYVKEGLTPCLPDANTSKPCDAANAAFWWFVGCWLRIGTISPHGFGIHINASNHAIIDGIQRRIVAVPFGMSMLVSRNGDAIGYASEHEVMRDWLQQWFHDDDADANALPEWAFSLATETRRAIVDGYVWADTHDTPTDDDDAIETHAVTSHDDALTLSMVRLAESLHDTPNSELQTTWASLMTRTQDATLPHDGHGAWGKCLDASPSRHSDTNTWHADTPMGITVYNLEVEEDNSYTINGIAVHNCQSFSAARPRSKSLGLDDVPGGKGLLWWQLDRIIRMTHPKWCLFENVDRLLKSPANNRGRDFATILACLADTGYDVEWHIVNAADYGNPQRRRRAFIFCTRHDLHDDATTAQDLLNDGIMAKALPIRILDGKDADGKTHTISTFTVPTVPTEAFNGQWHDRQKSMFKGVGAITSDGSVITCDALPIYDGHHTTLGEILVKDVDSLPDWCFVRDDEYPSWKAQRDGTHKQRMSKDGHPYIYSQGRMACPDPLDIPGRTILTAGGRGPSRMKHIVATGLDAPDRRYRILVPVELERLQCFPDGWTEGMTDTQRTFCMGNALVTDIPRRIGKALAESLEDNA